MGVVAAPSLDAVAAEPTRAAAFPPTIVAGLLAKCALVQGALLSRLLALQEAAMQQRDQRGHESDKLLTPAEAANLLGVTPRWLYRHARRLPFTRRLGRKTLRFSAVGLRRWQEQQH